MNDLRELYQQVILDHNRTPRNFGTIADATHHASGRNPLCGDHLELTMKVEDNIITDVKFEGSGCAISKSSASVMTEILKGKSLEEAQQLFEKFTHVVTTSITQEVDLTDMGKLAVFAGVREFPARVKCASLAWRTMEAALEGDDTITTE